MLHSNLVAESADSESTSGRKHAISVLETIYRHGVSPRPETLSRQHENDDEDRDVVEGLRAIRRVQNRRV